MRSILVVDPNPELRSFVSDLLTRSGHKVRQTAGVREAAALLRAGPADVLVTDLTRPDARGFETLEAIRREFPALELIALAAAPHPTGFQRLVATLGGRRTRAQPFTSRELMALVHELLAGVAAYTAHADYRARQQALPQR